MPRYRQPNQSRLRDQPVAHAPRIVRQRPVLRRSDVETLARRHDVVGNAHEQSAGKQRLRQVAPPERDALALEPAARTDAQRAAVANYYRTIDGTLQPLYERLASLQKARDDFARSIPTTLITVPREPRTIRVLPRGNWMDDSGDVVLPAIPASLPPLAADRRLTRLDLAQWLVAPNNPLTARVLVNRLWKLYFGAGLSRKMEDVGAQGDWPTHPLLIDYLAGRLIDSGWDLKQTIRLMVTSGVYRQSSLAREHARERDPLNRYWSRQGRFRLDAELVRDNVLAISGLLVERIGGPSVKPYQPRGYWAHLNFPVREWDNGQGEDLYRRGLYTHWQRQYLHPSLMAFDAPSREECTADRVRSNTPLQALVLLNDPTYVEAARALAGRIVNEGGNDTASRLRFAYQQVILRDPNTEEQKLLIALYEKHFAQFKADEAAAKQLQTVGDLKPPAGQDAAELAAWTSVSRVLLNLHEAIVRE